MSKKTEVTVGRKTYALTDIQANALMTGVFRFRRDGLATWRPPSGRKRPYIHAGYRSNFRASSKRGLVEMKLIDGGSYYHPAITAQGVRVAEALWPMFNDETMDELIQRLNYEDATHEKERQAKARIAIKAFTGIKDAEGRSVGRRIREGAASGEWHDSLKLDLDDLAAIGEQIIARTAQPRNERTIPRPGGMIR